MLRARSSSILSCVQILTQHDLLLYNLHFWSCGHASKECIHILNDIVNTFRAEINKIYHWTTVVTVQQFFLLLYKHSQVPHRHGGHQISVVVQDIVVVIIVIAVDFIPLEIAGKATILETS